MIAPLFFAALAMPFALALWVAAWLVGDLLAAKESAVVRVRSDDWRR